MYFLGKNERNNLVPKCLGFAEFFCLFCFECLPHPVSVDGVMQVANVTERHQANMMLRVTLPALSKDVY